MINQQLLLSIYANLTRPYSITLFGDSNFQYGDLRNGWVNLLRDKYMAKAAFYNMGISGITSNTFRQYMDSPAYKESLPRNIDMVVLSLGSNDATINKKSIQYVKLADYERNMNYIIDKSLQLSRNLFVILPPPVFGFKDRDQQSTSIYSQTLMQICKKRKIEFVDLRSIFNSSDFKDGIHFNDSGNQKIFDILQKQIGELPFWRPHWSVWEQYKS